MTQRIEERIFGVKGIEQSERLTKAYQTGVYEDEFTTPFLTGEQIKQRALNTLRRLPRCLSES